MEKLILFITLPLLAFSETPKADLSWVDNEIAAIKPPRKGLAPTAVSRLENPFATQLMLNQPEAEAAESAGIIASPVAETSGEPGLRLQAILNGSTAMIDGTWYREDEKIEGYVVKQIDDHDVLLQKGKKKLKLSLLVQNEQIKINVK